MLGILHVKLQRNGSQTSVISSINVDKNRQNNLKIKK